MSDLPSGVDLPPHQCRAFRFEDGDTLVFQCERPISWEAAANTLRSMKQWAQQEGLSVHFMIVDAGMRLLCRDEECAGVASADAPSTEPMQAPEDRPRSSFE